MSLLERLKELRDGRLKDYRGIIGVSHEDLREAIATAESLEAVREELTGADADWPADATEAQMVARVVKERDAALEALNRSSNALSAREQELLDAAHFALASHEDVACSCDGCSRLRAALRPYAGAKR